MDRFGGGGVAIGLMMRLTCYQNSNSYLIITEEYEYFGKSKMVSFLKMGYLINNTNIDYNYID